MCFIVSVERVCHTWGVRIIFTSLGEPQNMGDMYTAAANSNTNARM